jgi:hypothetical protein
MTDSVPSVNESWMILSAKRAKNTKGLVNLTLESGNLKPVIQITDDCTWKLAKKHNVKRWHQLAGKIFPCTCPEARTDLRSFLST